MGLDVEIKDVVDVLDNIVYDGEKIKYHFVLVDFWAELRGGDLILSHECLDAAWVGKDELDLHDLTKGARKAIEKVFRIAKNAGLENFKKRKYLNISYK